MGMGGGMAFGTVGKSSMKKIGSASSSDPRDFDYTLSTGNYSMGSSGGLATAFAALCSGGGWFGGGK